MVCVCSFLLGCCMQAWIWHFYCIYQAVSAFLYVYLRAWNCFYSDVEPDTAITAVDKSCPRAATAPGPYYDAKPPPYTRSVVTVKRRSADDDVDWQPAPKRMTAAGSLYMVLWPRVNVVVQRVTFICHSVPHYASFSCNREISLPTGWPWWLTAMTDKQLWLSEGHWTKSDGVRPRRPAKRGDWLTDSGDWHQWL